MVYNIYTTYFCNGYDWGMVPGIALPTLFFLVGGFNHLEKHEFVNGKDDIPYIMENKSHVPNHQPVIINH